ncbi:MAG: shikimate dehydrogenase [Pseudomonadota bacterium]|nr:shikimate dehydrogenase [Pseudomonadota bacterium]
MKITGSTRIFTIIAHPSTHVVAPSIFNRMFESMDLDMAYIAHDIPPGAVRATLEAYRSWSNLGGFNVTVPHKESVCALLDRLVPPASDIGAVNTVVRSSEGDLTGYNTDGRGAIRAIGDVRGARCLIVGAGGAARAIADALLKAGAGHISLLSRTPQKAASLMELFPAGKVDLFRAETLQHTDVVIHATPVADHIPLNLDIGRLNKKTRILETVIRDTVLSREAIRYGLTLIPGYRMLYHQVSENFRLLTGIEAPDEVIVRAFRESGYPMP